MDPQYWHDRWKNANTLFHKTEPHPWLVKYAHLLPVGKTMIPLCGKSQEMPWLMKLGHSIVGIELSPIACDSFFSENNIPYTKKTVGSFIVYQGKNISIWCGNIFDVPNQAWENITSIYDRAALVALPKDIRKKYTDLIKAQIKTNEKTFKNMLLITFEYDQKKAKGPPFSVPEKEVQKYYAKRMKISMLETAPDAAISNRLEKFKNVDVMETAYILSVTR